MNCKPNQLCVITRKLLPSEEKYRGYPVTVREHEIVFGMDRWTFDESMQLFGEPDYLILDESLTPIEPGESTEESIEEMRLLHQIEEKV